jgi:hypothetical protein
MMTTEMIRPVVPRRVMSPKPVVVSAVTVFLFVMTGIVYETQHWNNPEIKNYVDALYFP